MSISKSCQLIGLSRSSIYKNRQPKKDDSFVIDVLNQAVKKNGRRGFWKCFNWSRLEGYKINHKRFYRVYCALNLNLPRRRKKRLPQRIKQPMHVEAKVDQNWSMDFVHDTLFDGRRFRVLNIIDEGVREVLAIEVDTLLPASRVLRVLDRLKQERGLPRFIRVDNGPEFISYRLNEWCEYNHVELLYIQPGKPTQNAYTLNDLTEHSETNYWMFMCSTT